MKNIQIIFLLACALTVGCKKFLDVRSDGSLTVPETLIDVQALLDRNNILNTVHPTVGEGSCDDYWLTDAAFAALPSDNQRSNYTWGEELYYNTYPNDWSNLYSGIYIANTALETLNKIERTQSNNTAYEDALGQALFQRARLFFITATLFAKAYEPSSAGQSPGIPLRVSTDFNEVSKRASLQQSFERITTDIRSALLHLPLVSDHAMRPSKPAGYALAAKIFLYMGDYTTAQRYADSCLQYKNELLDYNSVNASSATPFAAYNKEVIFISFLSVPSHLNPSNSFIDTNLIASYSTNDLRKTIFFKDNGAKKYSFKGSYNGNIQAFSGLTVDETLLIRAECRVRNNNISGGLSDINSLLVKRYKSGTFTPLNINSQSGLLALIVQERRKELLLRDVRFSDLKRLNLDPQFAITIRRKLNGQLIEMPPNSPRYALPIPAVVIQQSGMQQNER